MPSVSNAYVAERTGATAPYFVNDVVTYVCATGYATTSASPIKATCTAGINFGGFPKWTPPTDADSVCKPGKTYFFIISSAFAKRAQNYNEKLPDFD